MALTLEDVEVDRLVQELTRLTGESEQQAVATALRERLEREARRRRQLHLREELTRMRERLAQLPEGTSRLQQEVLGYGEHGQPGE